MFALIAATACSAFAVDPCALDFKLLATRRFVLDNEVPLSEFMPGDVMRASPQNTLMPYWKQPPHVEYEGGTVVLSSASERSEGTLFVGAFIPGVHFSADFRSLSPNGAALLDIAPCDGSILFRVRAEPGKAVEFLSRKGGKALSSALSGAQVVPEPPFRLSAVVAGPTVLIAVRKDGAVRFLGSVTLDESPDVDIRRRDFVGFLKCSAGASLPPGGKAVLERATVSLTAGVGQADFCIVTDGPGCRPYMEDGRMFCTFSARAGMKYTKSVASFSPAVFDFRMEGILLANYGDGDPLLRNDAVNHMFRDADGTWKAVGCGWSTTAHNLDAKTRKGSGLIALESKECPLRGIHVLKARQLAVGSGEKSEDPHFFFDAETNKWRLATSTFTDRGLRAHLWESDRWDGPYVKIAGPTEHDSTGCQIMDFGGRKFVMTANIKRMRPVYEYPSLAYVGEWNCDIKPYSEECPNGRVFTAFAEMPAELPYRYVMLTMDRRNFPGMPEPNWTYGAMYFYGANPQKTEPPKKAGAHKPIRIGERGLWRICFDDGTSLSARDVSTNASDVATVVVEKKDGGSYVDLQATVTINSDKTATDFEFPARIRFDRNEIARFSYPGRGNWGPGLAFNEKFFADKDPKNGKWRSYAYCKYPSQFADFARVELKDGSSAAVFGMQPRPKRAGWDNDRPFVPVKTGVGADSIGGWYDHVFGVHLKKGDTWKSPVVRIRKGGTLRQNLEEYSRMNGFRRTLLEKVGDRGLLDRLKCAPLYKCEVNAETARRLLDKLPAPTLYHTTTYLKGGFDKEYPDHFPVNRKLFGTEEDLLDVIGMARAKGHLFMPYTNPTWWCDHPRGPTFVEKGEAPLLVNRDGSHRHETYSNGKVDGWQVTVRHPDVREANRKTLARFAGEFSVDLVFQDQVGARDWIYDMNPAARGATDMPESYIAMDEEDSASVRLMAEDGWDHVAENNVGLCGCNWWVFPFVQRNRSPRPHFKDKFPADCWEIEPITLYLFHDKCLFYSHNLGAFVTSPSILAWSLAFGYQMSYEKRRYEEDEAERDWYDWIHLVQRLVVSRIAGQKLMEFRHDRSALLERGGNPARRDDDGTIVARYGDVKVSVNLGDVARTVEGRSLAPYGWWIAAPGLVSGCPAGQNPFVETDGSRFEYRNGRVSKVK